MKTLIIDDEIDICFLLSGILKQNNCQTSYVNNLADAVVQLKNSCPVIVFLDNHLPDGMGVDFITYLKKNHPTTKVVMITAYDTPADRRKALAEGADLFIAKPFSREVIYQTVDELVD